MSTPAAHGAALTCRLVNDKLQSRKRKKDIARRLPVERTHGEIIILPLTDSKLFRKIIKRIETMRSIKFFVIFSVTAFYFAVMSRCERPDLFMLYTKLFKRFLEECRQLFLAVPHAILYSALISESTTEYPNETQGSRRKGLRLRRLNAVSACKAEKADT